MEPCLPWASTTTGHGPATASDGSSSRKGIRSFPIATTGSPAARGMSPVASRRSGASKAPWTSTDDAGKAVTVSGQIGSVPGGTASCTSRFRGGASGPRSQARVSARARVTADVLNIATVAMSEGHRGEAAVARQSSSAGAANPSSDPTASPCASRSPRVTTSAYRAPGTRGRDGRATRTVRSWSGPCPSFSETVTPTRWVQVPSEASRTRNTGASGSRERAGSSLAVEGSRGPEKGTRMGAIDEKPSSRASSADMSAAGIRNCSASSVSTLSPAARRTRDPVAVPGAATVKRSEGNGKTGAGAARFSATTAGETVAASKRHEAVVSFRGGPSSGTTASVGAIASAVMSASNVSGAAPVTADPDPQAARAGTIRAARRTRNRKGIKIRSPGL